METPNDRPHQDKPESSRAQDRTDEVRRVVADYIRDQKEILKALRRFFS